MAAISQPAQAAVLPIHVPAPAPVVLRVPEAKLPMRISKVTVNAEVLGRTAHSRIEFVFYNPNERALEGELQFPLSDGQRVTGFALDIHGELRAAVPVPKEKGQQVFEDVARRTVDPALLEQTQGNNYKLRVYPLPAHGSRRVVLEMDESWAREADKKKNYSTYRLPLQFSAAVEDLEVSVHNAAVTPRQLPLAVRAMLGAEPLKVNSVMGADGKEDAGSTVALTRRHYAAKSVLTIDYPYLATPAVATQTLADQTYFYAELSGPSAAAEPRTAPRKLGLVWDASGSGAARDHGLEFALLDAYFKALVHVNVTLVVARDRAEPAQEFAIHNGDWHALRDVLASLPYDGATAAEAQSPPLASDLNLLFTDGLQNYGSKPVAAIDRPLFVVNAAQSSDVEAMRYAAERSGGRFLDLRKISVEAAVRELTHQSARLVGMHSDAATELVRSSVYPGAEPVQVAGMLTTLPATVVLDWVDAKGRASSQQVVIKHTGKANAPLAALRWATLKLERLQADHEENREAIRRIGEQFGIVTAETSLIVLDGVEDYVRYGIQPPESLRVAYEALQQQAHEALRKDRQHHLDAVANLLEKKIAWWEMTFPKGDSPPVQDKSRSRFESADVSPTGIPAPGMAAPRPTPTAVAMAPAPLTIEVAGARADERQATAAAAAVAAAAAHATERARSAVSAPAGSNAAAIHLKSWTPDAPYLSRLREAPSDKLYAIYLDERPGYANSTAFFLDAADIFFERGQSEWGLRILSNLAEMNLENRQILRILAYRLLQAKQVALAISVLQKVLQLSPGEPQSWRDLGLAYAENGEFQRSADKLWEVVARQWDRRFPDIELVALNDLNAMLARVPAGVQIDTSRMDARLLKNLPLDVRVVLTWDADNTDIDLWVTDPNGEKVYFANPLSYQGGIISSDFTQGYGPEEFSLKFAKPGKYKVQAHYYGNHQQIVAGATTIMLKLSTGFGTPAQKDESVTLRLGAQGADVEVGTFEIGRN